MREDFVVMVSSSDEDESSVTMVMETTAIHAPHYVSLEQGYDERVVMERYNDKMENSVTMAIP